MKFNQLNQAVHSIKMTNGMKLRLKETMEMKEAKKLKKILPKKWLAFAVVFTILVTVLISPSFLSKSKVNFSITASATGVDGDEITKNLSIDKTSFELNTEERMNAITSVSGGETSYNFTDIKLVASGEDMETITYQINKGKFIEHVLLKDADINDQTQLVQDKIYTVYQTSDTEAWQGIKEIGDSYTVDANQQDINQYSLAIPPKNRNNEIIIIKATIKYKDGSTEKQDIIVTQESGSIALKLK